MRFLAIWYNLQNEVKRDIIEASDANEASELAYSKYAGTQEPAEALVITPMDQNDTSPGNHYARGRNW